MDECESVPCQHGVCIDRKNDFMCNCTGSGYIGRTCDIDIDECADMKRNCVFGECTNMPGTYRCTCNHGSFYRFDTILVLSVCLQATLD